MRILLLKPAWPKVPGNIRYTARVRMPPLGLGVLAAYSEGHDVQVVNGDWQPIPYDRSYDLVGISTTTFVSDAAYVAARRFRQQGAKVVLGGVHPTILPEEACEHADAVVVGEAESIWQDLLQDAERGRLRPLYRASEPTDMRVVRPPRRDLLDELPWFTAIEASRGCPARCRYCYLPHTPWAKHRFRPVESVAEELAGLPQRVLVFVDDNLFADRDHAIRLMRAIAPLKKHWVIQVPTTVVDDPELMDHLAEAGCFNAHVGFQSFNDRTLELARVSHNRVDKYRQLVSQLHQREIGVTGLFMFGFDTDGPDVFRTTSDMIRKIEVDDAGLFILTPFPGTGLYEQLRREGRLLDETRPAEYCWTRAVFRPKRMSVQQLEEGLSWTLHELRSYFRGRLLRSLWLQRRVIRRAPELGLSVMLGNLRQGTPEVVPGWVRRGRPRRPIASSNAASNPVRLL